MDKESIAVFLAIITSIIAIITFIGSILIFLYNYLKPGVKLVDLKFSQNDRIQKKHPAEMFHLSWPLLKDLHSMTEKGYKKVFLWYGIRKYEFQVQDPSTNHILMYKRK
jgi:hypothetical protein